MNTTTTQTKPYSYPRLSAKELATKLGYKQATLTVFEITDSGLEEKRMKVTKGVMYEVLADDTEIPANMEATFHVGWA